MDVFRNNNKPNSKQDVSKQYTRESRFWMTFRAHGPFAAVRYAISYIFGRIHYCFFRKADTFIIHNKSYHYFYHPYNTTWLNERCVEIPIVWEIVQSYSSRNILELGNVLSHYFPTSHDIVDKYEHDHYVICQDIIDFQPLQKYDLIVSISTLEHVGWDEEPRNPAKVLHALNHLRSILTPGGLIVLTVPLGYNPFVDKIFLQESYWFTETYFLKKCSHRAQWKTVKKNEIKNIRTGQALISTKVVAIAMFKL